MPKRQPIDVAYRKVSSLIPYVNNARTHDDAQVAQIAASIKEFGFTNPLLIDEDGGIIAGHGRLMAARQLGLDEVPTITLAGLSDAQRKAYVIADNKLALNAGWDADLLQLELQDLQALEFDLSLLGFSDGELTDLLHSTADGLTDPDDVPDAPEDPVTQPGDVWLLGKHRLVCGDSTDADVWEAAQIGEQFVVFSSPPYNVGDAAGLRDTYVKGKPKTNKFYGKCDDDKKPDEYASLLQVTLGHGLNKCAAVSFNLQPLANAKRVIVSWMNANADHLVDVITWDKGHAAPHIQPGILASRFEWIVIFSPKKKASRVVPLSSWRGKHSNVYTAPPQRKNEYAAQHGATFPVHLPQYVVGDLMNRSRGVVDCFMGTGTTLIAAEILNRECRGIEIDPAYVDIAVKRWQEFTGQTATLEATGQTFEEVEHGQDRTATETNRGQDAAGQPGKAAA